MTCIRKEDFYPPFKMTGHPSPNYFVIDIIQYLISSPVAYTESLFIDIKINCNKKIILQKEYTTIKHVLLMFQKKTY